MNYYLNFYINDYKSERILIMKKLHQFDEIEYENRWKNCQKEMEKEGIDVLVLSQLNNITYITGFKSNLFLCNFRPYLCVIKKGKLPILLIPNLELNSAKEQSCLVDIRSWGSGEECKDAIELLEKIFKEEKLFNCSIGMELDQRLDAEISKKDFIKLQDFLRNCILKSCSGLMWKIRRIKSKKEIELLQEANRIADASFDKVVESIKAGMNEQEARKIIGRTILDEGGDLGGFTIVVSGKDRHESFYSYRSNKIIEKGEMVSIDIGVVFKGYWTEITRIVFIDSISDNEKTLYRAIQKIHEAAIKAIKPGITVKEMDTATRAVAKQLGYEDILMSHGSGHGIGLDLLEPPFLNIYDKNILEPGMCFAVEPGINHPEIGQFRFQDGVVVSEKGSICLNNYNRSLIIK